MNLRAWTETYRSARDDIPNILASSFSSRLFPIVLGPLYCYSFGILSPPLARHLSVGVAAVAAYTTTFFRYGTLVCIHPIWPVSSYFTIA